MKKAAFIFPGQGSQYVGMGKDIHDRFPEVREVFERASAASDLNLKTLCFQGPEDMLTLTTYAQPAILTTSIALWACLGNPDAAFLAGHSLGEFTALAAGGSLDLETAVSLVKDRGRFMQEAVPQERGGMAAILGLDATDVEEICRSVQDAGRVWPANYNCPGQTVITGEMDGVQMAMDLAREKGARHSVLLPVSIPSHCPLMEPAARRLGKLLEGIEVKDLRVPLISNAHAHPVWKGKELTRNMVEQLTFPVRWEEGIRFMIREGVTFFIEVGPGKVLTGLVKRIDKQVSVMSISDAAGVEQCKESMQ